MGVPLAAADRRELEIVGLLRYVFAFKSMSVCLRAGECMCMYV